MSQAVGIEIFALGVIVVGAAVIARARVLVVVVAGLAIIGIVGFGVELWIGRAVDNSPAVDAAGVPFLPTSAAVLDPAAAVEIIKMTNLTRVQTGLSPLATDTSLGALAQQHSLEMAQLGYLSHDSPRLGAPADRAERAGIDFAEIAENIAYAPTLADAYQALLASPPHRQNVLWAPARRLGVGVARLPSGALLVTQDFAD